MQTVDEILPTDRADKEIIGAGLFIIGPNLVIFSDILAIFSDIQRFFYRISLSIVPIIKNP